MFGILYTQSYYEMLNNTIPLESLVEQAKLGGYDFLALSDSNLYGVHQFFKLTKKHQLKSVIGLKIFIEIDLEYSGFLVYVKDQQGYKNLLKLLQLKNERVLSLEDLVQHQKGLIFVSSGSDSLIDQSILKDDFDKAFGLISRFKVLPFYIGLSLDTFDQEMKVAPKIVDMANKKEIFILPIHQTSYLNQEDAEAYDALIKIDSDKNERRTDADYSFKTKEELTYLFQDYPYVFEHLSRVISSITYTYEPPTYEMPLFDTPEGTAEQYLRSLAIVGLKKRLKKLDQPDEKAYQKRLIYELEVIHRMGYDAYFLIVYDFVKYAKNHDILVGPGRGSSAGSLVAYCLGITDVNPLEYDLLFERFLNPNRQTMPDIDMDFPDDKRDQVLQYVKEKYGKEHVLSIVTFGTFALRSSIRDIARVMKIDNQRVNGIIKRVINDDIDETDLEMVRLLKVAKKIEGLPRHTGTHAAGIVLAKQNLTESIPIQLGINDFYQSQLEQKDLEALGLLKMDFLGIRNLSIIDEIVKQIQVTEPAFSLLDIPLDDQKTYTILSAAQTSGIFQLESSGMRNVLRKLKPETFEDIIAVLALFRPGPMDQINEYIERRNGKAFSYVHDALIPILKSTYGIIVYQEQIMRIAHEFAGYTLAEADILRRGVSKKDKDVLEEERTRFISKCREQKHSESLTIEIYDYIVKFADYGFNRSHSVAYAFVAYQMAYLKANYFPIFMTSLLSNVIGNEQATADYIQELKLQNIPIKSPDINQSGLTYIYREGALYLPLLAVKSLGKQTVQKILDERQKEPFKDYQDFKLRCKKDVNERNLEMLIYAGAFDAFGLNHPTMLAHKDIMQAGYELYITDFKMKILEDEDDLSKSAHEKEALGFNLTYHPLLKYEHLLNQSKYTPLHALSNQSDVWVIAYITHVKKIKTRQGKQMAFIQLEDGQSVVEATLFDEKYKKYMNDLTDVKIIHLRINNYKDQISWIVESMSKPEV